MSAAMQPPAIIVRPSAARRALVRKQQPRVDTVRIARTDTVHHYAVDSVLRVVPDTARRRRWSPWVFVPLVFVSRRNSHTTEADSVEASTGGTTVVVVTGGASGWPALPGGSSAPAVVVTGGSVTQVSTSTATAIGTTYQQQAQGQMQTQQQGQTQWSPAWTGASHWVAHNWPEWRGYAPHRPPPHSPPVPSTVPEPATVALLGAGLLVLAAKRRTR